MRQVICGVLVILSIFCLAGSQASGQEFPTGKIINAQGNEVTSSVKDRTDKNIKFILKRQPKMWGKEIRIYRKGDDDNRLVHLEFSKAQEKETTISIDVQAGVIQDKGTLTLELGKAGFAGAYKKVDPTFNFDANNILGKEITIEWVHED